jgi:hypothetical protein
MIYSIGIQGYRCFKQFHAHGLRTLNLLVGKNNCGKTALLEALQLLGSPGTEHQQIWASIVRRGEAFPRESEFGMSSVEFEVAHLFHGHETDLGSRFVVSAETDRGPRDVRCEIVESEHAQQTLFTSEQIDEGSGYEYPLAIRIDTSGMETPFVLPLTARRTLTFQSVRSVSRTVPSEEESQTTFITTDSLSAYHAEAYWKEIALYPEEHLVLDALRLLEPGIERIAFIGSPRRYQGTVRGGPVVKLQGSGMRIPIGTMGDGMWRMLAMALALVRSRGGLLLVDEVDTGLHHTVMSDMWRMVLDTALRLNVQVFATTHSSDCTSSLAGLCKKSGTENVSVQRIECGKEEAVAFSENEIFIAAHRGIEIR